MKILIVGIGGVEADAEYELELDHARFGAPAEAREGLVS